MPSGHVRFLFEDHATQKRKAKIALDREAKKARGGLDLRFEGLDQDARHAAWRREIWNGKEVTLSHEKFLARTGPEVGARAFWDALKAEQRAATRTKAEADGKVREMTREIKQPDAFKPGQDNEGAMPFGAGVDRLTGPWLIGDLKDKYIISVVEAAAKRRGVSLEDMGVDYARVLLITRRALEQKLRLVGMDNNARCVTTALTTGRDFILLGVEAAERALARLVAEMRVAAMANARDVVALGDRNRGEVLADLRRRRRAERLLRRGGRRRFGRRRGVARRASVGSARRGETERHGRVGFGAGVVGRRLKGRDWVQAVVDRASRLRSASRERVVTVTTDAGSAVSLDPTSPTFLVELARALLRNSTTFQRSAVFWTSASCTRRRGAKAGCACWTGV